MKEIIKKPAWLSNRDKENTLELQNENSLNVINRNVEDIIDEIRNNPNIEKVSYNFYNGTERLITTGFINNVRTFRKIVRNGYTINENTFQVNTYITVEQRNNEIRRLYKEERLIQIELADIFGLNQSTISRIVNS